MSSKPRILIITDTACIDSGMGVAHKEIATRLYATQKYEIASFGWFFHSAQQRGVGWTYPWKQFTTSAYDRPYGHPEGWPNASSQQWKDSTGYQIIEKFKPDVVIALGDMWMCDWIYSIPNRKSFKLMHELPVDGEPVPREWTRLFKTAETPIVMSQYGRDVITQVDKYMKVEYLPRGIDLTTFRPINATKDELRKRLMPGSEGKFVVGVFDRYQDRKQIHRAVESFAKFVQDGKHQDCDIYLHLDMNDPFSKNSQKSLSGENGIIERYGIENHAVINQKVTVEKGVPIKELVALYNCVHGDTRVILESGKTEKIKNIVSSKYDGKILSVCKNGKHKKVSVVNWYKKVDKRSWVFVSTGNSRHARHRGTICTPDHKWNTQRGWVEAKDLIVGTDRTYTKYTGSDDLIHGTLLGDGHASKKSRLVVGHLDKDYADIKSINLGVETKSLIRKGFGKWRPFHTSEVGISREWRDRFYKNGKKIFLPPTNWRMIAIWYGDDGCLGNNIQPRFAIQSFNTDDVLCWFKKFLISSGGEGNAKVYKDGSLVINGKDKEIFFSNISQFLPEPVRYKLPSNKQYDKYNGWLNEV